MILKHYIFSAGSKGFITVTATSMLRAFELAKYAFGTNYVDFEGYKL